jgi:hypothetical protein
MQSRAGFIALFYGTAPGILKQEPIKHQGFKSVDTHEDRVIGYEPSDLDTRRASSLNRIGGSEPVGDADSGRDIRYR